MRKNNTLREMDGPEIFPLAVNQELTYKGAGAVSARFPYGCREAAPRAAFAFLNLALRQVAALGFVGIRLPLVTDDTSPAVSRPGVFIRGFTVMRAIAALAAILFFTIPARGEVGLVEVCLAGEGYSTQQGNQCPSRSWERPGPGKAVLSCGALTDPAACTWFHAELRYRRWESIPDDELVQTCAADVEPGPFSSVDPCGSGGHTGGKPRIPRAQVIGAGPSPGYRQVVLSWEHPTERIDGTALPLEEIANTMVFWGPEEFDLGAAPPQRTMIVPSPASEVQVTVAEGLTYFSARTVDTGGLMSMLAPPISKDVTIDPNAPGEIEAGLWMDGPLEVGEDTAAYAFFASRDTITLIWVGTVEPGTECDPLQGVNGLYVVPRSAVDLDVDGDGIEDSTPEAVVARCSTN